MSVEKRTQGSTNQIQEDHQKEMSNMRAEPIAILCSDIHLSEKAPIARSAEKDWFEAQSRPLKQIQALSNKYDVPVICAGDVFDKWNPSPALINFAMDMIPNKKGFYSVSGQHDQPFHRYDDIQHSAYWTLVKAERIINISGVYAMNKRFVLHGFHWNELVRNLPYSRPHALHLAVIHAYIWKKGFSFPNAPEDASVSDWNKRLLGYDAAVFGDNHKGFLVKQSRPCNILNSGTLMRRKIDEINYRPCVGILNSDKSIIRFPLDISEDKFIQADTDLIKVDDQDFTDFIEDLRTLADKGMDFVEILKQQVNDGQISEGAKNIIIQALEAA